VLILIFFIHRLAYVEYLSRFCPSRRPFGNNPTADSSAVVAKGRRILNPIAIGVTMPTFNDPKRVRHKASSWSMTSEIALDRILGYRAVHLSSVNEVAEPLDAIRFQRTRYILSIEISRVNTALLFIRRGSQEVKRIYEEDCL
jgi:hypothetical protein